MSFTDPFFHIRWTVFATNVAKIVGTISALDWFAGHFCILKLLLYNWITTWLSARFGKSVYVMMTVCTMLNCHHTRALFVGWVPWSMISTKRNYLQFKMPTLWIKKLCFHDHFYLNQKCILQLLGIQRKITNFDAWITIHPLKIIWHIVNATNKLLFDRLNTHVNISLAFQIVHRTKRHFNWIKKRWNKPLGQKMVSECLIKFAFYLH